MIDCQKVLSRFAEFIDKELDSKSTKELEEHLNLCRQCFDRVDFEKKLKEKMKGCPPACCPDKVKKRIKEFLDKF